MSCKSSSTPLKQKNANVSTRKETIENHEGIMNKIQITISSSSPKMETNQDIHDTSERSSSDHNLFESTSPMLVRAFLHKFITVEKKMTVNNFVFKAIKVPYSDFQMFIRCTSFSKNNSNNNNDNLPSENSAHNNNESEEYTALARQTATFASTVRLMKNLGFFHNQNENKIDLHQVRRRQREEEQEEKKQQQTDESEAHHREDVAAVITPTFSSSALSASRSNKEEAGSLNDDNTVGAGMMGTSGDSSSPMSQMNLSPSTSSAAGDDDDDDDDDNPFITLLNSSSSEQAKKKWIAKSKPSSSKNRKSEQVKIASSFLLKLTEHAKSIMLPEELIAIQNGEGQTDQVEKMKNSRFSHDSNKENISNDAAVECNDKQNSAVSLTKDRIVAPLGTVPIYDDCDQVRQKLEALRSKFCATLLRQQQQEQLQDGSSERDDSLNDTTELRQEHNPIKNKNLLIDQTTSASASSSVAVMCKAVAAVSGRIIHGSQWKRFFDNRRGPFAGAESIVYADGYLFLEKLRVFNGEPKSRERLENEKRCDERLPGLGFERIDETRRTAMKVVRRK